MNQVTLYQTQPHDCDYLPREEATTVFVDPRFPKSMPFYDALIQQGFRRSGGQIYRPQCPGCGQCISVRVPVAEFQPRRSQRRCWRKNEDLVTRSQPPRFHPEHYDLFSRYVRQRHPGGGMAEHDPVAYLNFLASDWSRTRFYEFRRDGELLAVAVVDVFATAWSAVYTFYDPDQEDRGLGVYSVLWQIHQAQAQGMEWLYLGYWIRDCRKMRYKNEYQPLEYCLQGRWVRGDQIRYPATEA